MHAHFASMLVSH